MFSQLFRKKEEKSDADALLDFAEASTDEIDYKDDLQGASFVIRNPQATATCGCGSSFAYG